jgi:hypothetical protein
MKHSQREDDEEVAQFYALRREFVLNRNPTPPYDIPSRDKWLPANFDYAAYQANCVSKFMVSMVTFSPLTWVALWLYIALVFAFMLIVDGQYLYLSIVWVALAYLSIGLIYFMDRKAEWVMERMLNPAFLRAEDAFPDFDREFNNSDSEAEAIIGRLNKGISSMHLKEPASEDTPLVIKAGVSSATLAAREMNGLSHVMRLRNSPKTTPGWVEAEIVKPGIASRFLYGPKAIPNKHHSLMLGDLAGPDLQMYILRVFLLIQAIYVSVLAVYFSPYMYYHYGDFWGTVYLLVAIVPEFILYVGFYPRLIMRMTLVASNGLLKQAQIVKDVVRAQKTQKLVRTLMMLTKLKAASKKQKRNAADYKPKEYDLTNPDVKAKYDAFVKVFKTYDVDGTGKYCNNNNVIFSRFFEWRALACFAQIILITISMHSLAGDVDSKELGMMLKSLGMSLSDDELEQMFILLDLDGDGTVVRTHIHTYKPPFLVAAYSKTCVFRIFLMSNPQIS